MNFGSVCSGIEAASVAWHPLGWHTAFVSEIEKFPCRVLAHHYPDVPNRGDMTKFQEWPDAGLDVLVGGTPCQSFSVAGLRKGMADPRGNLALVYLALADRYRPRWLVWENVPGVLSSSGGRDFGAFLGGLVELGYGFAYRVLDAQFFGVAQRRRRVFVVGYLGDWRRAAAVLFERHSLQGHPAPRRESGERPAPTISARPSGGGGLGTDFDCDGGLIPSWPAEVACTLNAAFGSKMGLEDQHALSGAPLFVPAMAFKSGQSEAAGGVFVTEEFAPTLQAQNNGSTAVPAVAFTTEQTPKFSEERALTLTKQSPTGGGQPQCVAQAMAVRRLTPRECERLQGFPDDYTLLPGKSADGPRYKALGNSMAVPVMRWIGERIAQVESLTPTHPQPR